MGSPHKLFSSYARQLSAAALLSTAVLSGSVQPALRAQGGGRFDLTGPRIDVHVQRGDKSLPIAMVPNLQPGDALTIHADLPQSQSVKMILVVVFLRGSTNPPTEKFFTKIDTWDKKVRSEGATVTVPDEAQQALLFLAPETGGDYSTLKSAVMGRPGVFVRAAQDLNESSFEQARIERYLQAIRRVPAGSPAQLLDHSHKLAATLNLKVNDDCFKKTPDQQLSCLRQSGSQLLLDDGHGTTLASTLTQGDSANLIGAVAGTPMASAGGAGVYSAYVGTVIDLVRLMSGLHTAHFQYIPAIAFPDAETLNLRLNTAPSFHNPKSVIVVALPAIQPSVAPSLRLQDPSHVSCLLQPAMVLPLEGAPLVFATGFAHDLVLHLNGATIDDKTELPLVPDAYEGGLVLASHAERKPLAVAAPEASDAKTAPTSAEAEAKPETDPALPNSSAGSVAITGTLHGSWGFDTFTGVTVPLQRRTGSGWAVSTGHELYAGRSNQVLLQADGTACASRIDLDVPGRDDVKLAWKQATENSTHAAPALSVQLPLEKAAPGSLSLLVHQYGTVAVARVAVTAYSDRTRLTGLRIHAGDSMATLSGSGLADVVTVQLGTQEYTPLAGQPVDTDTLRLSTKVVAKDKDERAALSSPGATGSASAVLRDGRTLPVTYKVDAARPTLDLISRTVKLGTQTGLPLSLPGSTDLPLDSMVTLALRSAVPARFARTEKVEIALTDGSLRTVLGVADGSLVLQDAHTALAFLSPAKAFGTSAFGPVQMRPVLEDGTEGDWLPLGAIVRLPTIASVTCSRPLIRPATGTVDGIAPAADTSCSLAGTNLFLLDSVAADSAFTTSVPVPAGFADDTLPVPRPADGHTLYLRLRDDPATVIPLTLPAPTVTTGAHHSGPIGNIPVALR